MVLVQSVRSHVLPVVVALGVVLVAPALGAPLADAIGILATPTFATPINLPDSNGFGEPSIDAAPDGTLYIVAPGTGTWRSDNAGVSWIRVANTLGDSGDSDIEVDINGIVYGSDLSTHAPVSVSNNKATSYQFETETNTGNNLDREWIAVAGAGHVYATVRDGGNEEITISHDGGVTFSAPITVANNAGWRGNVIAPTINDIYIPHSNGAVKLSVSHNAGVTWTTRNVAAVGGTECIFPGVARDSAGTLYMVWCEFGAVGFPSSGNARIFITASKNDGVTWSTPVLLSDDANYNVFPWVVAGGPGRVFVTWYTGVPTLPDPLHIRDPSLALFVNWNVQVAYSTTADQASPSYGSVAASGIMHTGPICTGGTGCPPGTRGLLDFFEMVEQPGGKVAITYAGGDQLPTSIPNLNDDLGTPVSLFAVVQTGGTNLRTG